MIYNSKQKQNHRENLKRIERERQVDAVVSIVLIALFSGIVLAAIIATLNLLS